MDDHETSSSTTTSTCSSNLQISDSEQLWTTAANRTLVKREKGMSILLQKAERLTQPDTSMTLTKDLSMDHSDLPAQLTTSGNPHLVPPMNTTNFVKDQVLTIPVATARALRVRAPNTVSVATPKKYQKASPSPKSKSSRKNRNANYSDSEIVCLLKQVLKRGDILWSCGSTPSDVAAKKACWDEIGDEVSKCSNSAVRRSGKEVRKKFSKVKMAVLGHQRGEACGKVDFAMIDMMNDILNQTERASANSFLEMEAAFSWSKSAIGKEANEPSGGQTDIERVDSRIYMDANEITVNRYHGEPSKSSHYQSGFDENHAVSNSKGLQPVVSIEKFETKSSDSRNVESALFSVGGPSRHDLGAWGTNTATKSKPRKSPYPRKLELITKPVSYGRNKKKFPFAATNRVANFSLSEIETMLDVCEANKEEFFIRGLFVRKRNLTTAKLRAWQLITDAVNKRHSEETGIKRKMREVRKKVLKMRSAARKVQGDLDTAIRDGKPHPVIHKSIHRMMRLMEAELSHMEMSGDRELLETTQDESGLVTDKGQTEGQTPASKRSGPRAVSAELNDKYTKTPISSQTKGTNDKYTKTPISSQTKGTLHRHLQSLAQTCQKLRKLGVDISMVILTPASVMTFGSDQLTVVTPESMPWTSIMIQAQKNSKCCLQLDHQSFSNRWKVTTFDPASQRASGKVKRALIPDFAPADPASPETRQTENPFNLPLNTDLLSDGYDGEAPVVDGAVDDDCDTSDVGADSAESDSDALNVVFACEQERTTEEEDLMREPQPPLQPKDTTSRAPAMYNCLLCLKAFPTPMGLSIHSRRVHNMRRKDQHLVEPPAVLSMPANTKKGVFPCDICGKTFAWKKSLKQHKFVHDKNKRFQCEMCGREFTYKYNMNLHMRVHKDVRPSQCQFCDRSFHMSSTLKVHIRRKHTGERPYLCDLCGQSFFTKTIMSNHRRTHTGETPFVCVVCGESFKHRSALVFHQHTHTNDQPNLCRYCGKAFRTSYKLKVHLRMHTGEKPYTCEACGEKFARSDTLKQHVKNKHADFMEVWGKMAALRASQSVLDVEQLSRDNEAVPAISAFTPKLELMQ